MISNLPSFVPLLGVELQSHSAAEDTGAEADAAVSADRFELESVVRDDLAQAASDQLADQVTGRGESGHARAHSKKHAHHERAAWLKLANAERTSNSLHRKQIAAQHAATPHGANIVFHQFAGSGVRLHTTPQAAQDIAAGKHQIPVVDGKTLAYPSQDLSKIESADPLEHGQTHGLTKHTGKSLADNVARLRAEPHIRAAGGYFDAASAQRATNETIANPANQKFISEFLADPGRTKAALQRVDLGADVGASTLRKDLDAGRPSLVPGHTATVVLIKDPSFPEGYRTLTTYPDGQRAPEVDAEGKRIG